MLLGDGKGGFTAHIPAETGFRSDGDSRGMALLKRGKKNPHPLVVCVQNNDSLLTYQWKMGKVKIQTAPESVDRMKGPSQNGSEALLEFYRGSGYLSQSARIIWSSDQ